MKPNLDKSLTLINRRIDELESKLMNSHLEEHELDLLDNWRYQRDIMAGENMYDVISATVIVVSQLEYASNLCNDDEVQILLDAMMDKKVKLLVGLGQLEILENGKKSWIGARAMVNDAIETSIYEQLILENNDKSNA